MKKYWTSPTWPEIQKSHLSRISVGFISIPGWNSEVQRHRKIKIKIESIFQSSIKVIVWHPSSDWVTSCSSRGATGTCLDSKILFSTRKGKTGSFIFIETLSFWWKFFVLVEMFWLFQWKNSMFVLWVSSRREGNDVFPHLTPNQKIHNLEQNEHVQVCSELCVLKVGHHFSTSSR